MTVNHNTFDAFHDRGGWPLIEMELAWPEIDRRIADAEQRAAALLIMAQLAVVQAVDTHRI